MINLCYSTCSEVVVLKIENKGSLALKYAANMNIFREVAGENKDGDAIVLSDILTVSTLTFADAGVDPLFGFNIALKSIEAAFADENGIAYNAATSFKDGNILEDEENLLPGEIQYVAIKVDMAETVGNEANHNGVNVPTIEFGLNVLATQYTHEDDSFGDQYDKEATYDEFWDVNADISWYTPEATEFTINNINQLAGLAKLVNNGVDNFSGKTFTLANDIDLNNLAWNPIGTSSAAPFAGTFNGNGKTVSNLMVVGDNGNAGLFGYVSANASVSNLKMHNATITDEGNNTTKIGLGAVIGTAKGAVTMDNVTLTGLIQIGSVTGVMENGALIGYSQGAKVTNCSVIGENGSFVAASRWVGAIVGYDNTTMQMSGCRVENITLKATAYCGGLTSVINQKSVVKENAVKNVNIVLENADGVEAAAYGALLGSSKTYSYSSSPYSFTAYDNTVEGVSYTVNGAVATAQDFGAKVSDGTDPDLAMAATIKVGNSYYSYLKFATSVAPKDGSEYVIELTGDTMIRAKFKPTVAAGQNIVIKTNGYKLLNVEQDSSKNVVYNDDGTLKTIVVTNENVSSCITIKSGGTLVIE